MSRKKYPRIKDFSEIGERIRLIRGALTQGAFAEIFGVNQNTVSRWEKGIVLSDEETLKKIADYGKVSVKWLLRGEEKAPELPEPGESITIESPALPSIRHDPFIYGALDINGLAQIIELLEELLSHRKKRLKPVKYALLLSLLYDEFQKTGQPLNQATLKAFLRRVD